MIDHLELKTSDLPASVRFYAEVLKPLGYNQKVDGPAKPLGYPEMMFLSALVAATRSC